MLNSISRTDHRLGCLPQSDRVSPDHNSFSSATGNISGMREPIRIPRGLTVWMGFSFFSTDRPSVDPFTPHKLLAVRRTRWWHYSGAPFRSTVPGRVFEEQLRCKLF